MTWNIHLVNSEVQGPHRLCCSHHVFTKNQVLLRLCTRLWFSDIFRHPNRTFSGNKLLNWVFWPTFLFETFETSEYDNHNMCCLVIFYSFFIKTIWLIKKIENSCGEQFQSHKSPKYMQNESKSISRLILVIVVL